MTDEETQVCPVCKGDIDWTGSGDDGVKCPLCANGICGCGDHTTLIDDAGKPCCWICQPDI